MKTLKKSLCLVLALVMVLGLCVVGVGATTFTDDEEITYEDAVTVMQGLGILNGYPDGSFKPAKNVTRAEAAKMITYMILGEKYAEKLSVGESFSDMVGHWAAKYVSYCVSRGIINGMGDGTFRPDADVTGLQMVKMLLAACGYGVKGEYVGSNWDVNVFSDAVENDLFEDAEVDDFTVAATREECALYEFHALDTVHVAWDVDYNQYLPNGETFAAKVWNLGTYTGIVTKNQATGETYTVIGNRNFAVETGSELIGHQVKMYYNTKAKKDADKVDYYNAYLASDISTVVPVTGTLADLAKAVDYVDTDFNSVEIYMNGIDDGDTLGSSIASTAALYQMLGMDTNFKATPSFAKNTQVMDLTKNLGYVPIKNANGSKDTAASYIPVDALILNEDGEIISAIDEEYAVGEVVNADDEVVLVKFNGSSEEIKLENCYEGIEKGDYVTVTWYGNVFTILPTSTVTVEVSKIDKSWAAFGWYFWNNYAVSHTGPEYAVNDDDGEEIGLGDIQLGDTIKFYVDARFNAFDAVRVDTSAVDYVFVTLVYDTLSYSYGKQVHTATVQGVDANGKVVTLKLASGTDVDEAADLYEKKLCEVKTNSKGVSTLNPGAAGIKKISTAVASDLYKGNESRIDGTRYYLGSTTKYIYAKGTKSNLSPKLGDFLKTELNAIVYYVINPDKSTQTVPAVWVYGMDAPVKDATNFIYVAGGRDLGDVVDVLSDESLADLSTFKANSTPSGTVKISSKTYNYYTLYIDGISTGDINMSEDVVSLPVGFYTYTVKSGIYTLTPVAEGKSEAILVDNKTDIYKGSLLVEGTAMDDVDLSDYTIVDLSVGYKDAKGYSHAINSADAMYAALDAGYAFTMTYMLNSDGEPTGILYVTLSGFMG